MAGPAIAECPEFAQGAFDHPHVITYTPETATQIGHITDALHAAFPDEAFEVSINTFDDKSPLVTVQTADHAVLLTVVTGHNIHESITDMILVGDAYTGDNELTGRNTHRFTTVVLYAEVRQDRTQEVPINGDGELATIPNQAVTARALAKVIAKTMEAQDVVTIGLHSKQAADFFGQFNLEHINLSLGEFIAEYLVKAHVLDDRLEHLVGLVDMGNTNTAFPFRNALQKLLGKVIPIAFVEKWRIPFGDGTKSKTFQRFLENRRMIKGRRIIIYDDIASSGGTFLDSADAYFAEGAEEIVFIVNEAIFVGKYKENIATLLQNPKIRIFVTNILPTGKRGDRCIELPEVEVDGQIKTVEVIDVIPEALRFIRTVAQTHSLGEVRELLADAVWDMKKPAQLYEEETGKPYTTARRIVGVLRNGVLYQLSQKRRAILKRDNPYEEQAAAD